ncbi:hypothetical protein LMG19083_01189 [Ralstonia psammae]|uniref:Uncharacterized protein n=1 Tax=Ralstonia psammae TaxID=3058598 RepID=A0ABN9ILY6_9RALS|nr:hypothetical protein LMG19083_01189 [Ralstonia sp. LMG 19083]
MLTEAKRDARGSHINPGARPGKWPFWLSIQTENPLIPL